MIGIVGGGLAGLAAAYRLKERGQEVRIFEAGGGVGGLAGSYETAGDPVESYYHHLSKSEETIVDLADELGIGDRIEWRVGKNAYYVDGVVHPLDTPWQIAAYPHLSLYDKFRLGMLVSEIDVRALPTGLPRRDTYDSLEAFEDIPITDFLLEHTTRGVYEGFWQPLLEAKFGSRADDVSAAWLLGRIKFRGERDLLRGEILGYVDGGFSTFVDALVSAVGRERIETGTRVTDIGFENGAVESLTVEASSGGETDESEDEANDKRQSDRYDVDGVVVATMPTVLESLTGYECEIDFQGTICSVFATDRSLTDTYWLNIADDAPFGVFIEHTNFVPPERYGGEHLYYLASYVQDPTEALWQLSNDEVERRWLAGVTDLFPSFDDAEVNWIQTARNPQTAPVYERGYLEMVVPYDLSPTVGEGVYYAGMASRAQYPERSLNGAIEAGFVCADRILE